VLPGPLVFLTLQQLGFIVPFRLWTAATVNTKEACGLRTVRHLYSGSICRGSVLCGDQCSCQIFSVEARFSEEISVAVRSICRGSVLCGDQCSCQVFAG